jgi:hypothetical protein
MEPFVNLPVIIDFTDYKVVGELKVVVEDTVYQFPKKPENEAVINALANLGLGFKILQHVLQQRHGVT